MIDSGLNIFSVGNASIGVNVRGYYTFEEIDSFLHEKLNTPQIIPNGSNLNDYQTSGMYYQPANAQTTDSINLPVENTAFSLLVEKNASVKQTFTTYNTSNPRTFVRVNSWDNNGWGAWKELSFTGHTHDDRYFTESEITSKLNSKANSSHNHTGWTYLKVNDYSSLYHNDNLGLVHFRYYRSSVSFTAGTPVQVATIPSAYRPRQDGPITCYSYDLGCHVAASTGQVNVMSKTTGSHHVNIRGIWFI